MADLLPEITSLVVDILRDLGESELAARLPEQRFHGRCRCRADCTYAMSAPPGSSGTFMLWLELGGEILGEASLDPDCTMITNFTIDHLALGVSPDWLTTADAAITPGLGHVHQH
jgi:hypothetical protein